MAIQLEIDCPYLSCGSNVGPGALCPSGQPPGQFKRPYGVMVINQGRIIVADTNNNRLQSFTCDGHFISSFDCCDGESPLGVAFDSHRGLIAFSTNHQVHVIGCNQWLPDTKFIWQPDRHRYAPRSMKRSVMVMTMIRSLIHLDHSSSVHPSLSLIPNEILFLIFEFL